MTDADAAEYAIELARNLARPVTLVISRREWIVYDELGKVRDRHAVGEGEPDRPAATPGGRAGWWV